MTTPNTTATTDSESAHALQGTSEPNVGTPGTPATETGPESPTGNEDESAGKNGGNAEAARYRRQLRDTEAERDALTAKVEAYQRAEIERLAGELAQPADLFTIAGVTVADLLGEDGEISAEAVAEKVAELLAERPGLSANATIRPRPTHHDYGQAYSGFSGYSGGGGASHSWHAALRPPS